MKSLLFVCLGNICRSPLAEGIARKIILEKNLNIIVDSTGTGDWHIGEAPCDNSIKVASLHGIDISKQASRQVTKDDFVNFDVIVGLDDSNMLNLQKLGAKNPIKLGSFGQNNEDVPDPYFFNGFEGFEKVYEMIESCVTQLIREKQDA